MTLVQPATPDDWLRARRLVEEYAASLGVDLSFQDFGHEIDHLAEEYSPPEGAFLVALDGNAALGCVAMRRLSAGVCEMKRLYAVPAARGRGVGRRLVAEIVAAARGAGYSTMRLDTLPTMRAARALYATFGFREIDAYRFNPVEGTSYLELDLR